jgi:hypothetical protein
MILCHFRNKFLALGYLIYDPQQNDPQQNERNETTRDEMTRVEMTRNEMTGDDITRSPFAFAAMVCITKKPSHSNNFQCNVCSIS